jgi:NTE family protein
MAASRIGLSLSGGGYRAAAFHLGTLKKLNEMNILPEVSVISTISGGSILGAAYLVSPDEFPEFEEDVIDKLSSKNLVLRAFFTFPAARFTIFCVLILASLIYFICHHQHLPVIITVLFTIILLYFFQFIIFPVSGSIEKSYAKYFTNGRLLHELPDSPRLVLGATNMQTARPFIFSRNFMGDSALSFAEIPVKFEVKDFPLARAVMASSCVPGAFSPVMIGQKYFVDPALYEKNKPVLADGGVYDNQGIHKVMQQGYFECDIVITSDAGNRLAPEKVLRNSIQVAIRTMNVFMTRIKNAQMVTDIYQNNKLYNKEVAYLSLGWDVENAIPGFIRNLKNGDIPQALIDHHHLDPLWVKDPEKYKSEITDHLEKETGYSQIIKPDPEEIKIARAVGTNLTPLSKHEIAALMKQAAALTEIQIRLYCPSLLI